ncbi:hypothetical protein CPB84DRAFT_1744588 [Gymnopilus junonius]|uniref:PSP1 C-terminal domain-containing protein n=1 Tax=Gymnopilus junonius TaxID=109634 RepID=A0A9P5TQM0_GYMJU|nr:hypothetical protein CPB84DRAFT_1744588 [Gymnopilus junonius]
MERSQPEFDEDDRRSRFHQNLSSPTENGHRERAASQPPSSDSFTSPLLQNFVPTGGPWPSSRMLSPPTGRGQPLPIRSSSFSSHPQSQFSSTMRDRAFPSTFEDDESEALSDTYDERYIPPSLSSNADARGRSYGQDLSRSRSQSLAAGRPGPVGSPYTGSSAMQSWNESYLTSNPLSVPSRYGDIKPPGSASRYGSLGTSLGRSPTNLHSSSPSSSLAVGGNNGYSRQADISNMSPFVRDVGQILLDDGSAFRELWAGMNPPRDENGGGGSGTTSRRHSVSVVQPRRGNVVGFNAPIANPSDLGEESTRPSYQPPYSSRGSGLLLSDDDLASDLGMLNINPNEPPPLPSSSIPRHQSGLPPSQPSSLPIYAPLSRSPPSRDLMATYQSINLSIPGGGAAGNANVGSYSRQAIGTPSDGDFSAGGNSPSIGSGGGLYEEQQQQFASPPQGHGQYVNKQQQQQEMAARYIPGQGIQYSHSQHSQQQQQFQQQQQQPQQYALQHQRQLSTSPTQYVRARAPSYSSTSSLQSPLSPSISSSSRPMVNPQQGPYFPQIQQQQQQRRLSDAQHHQLQLQTPTSPHGPHGAFALGAGAGFGLQSPTSAGGLGGLGQGQGQGQALSDLGKGLPLHSVPSSWPLYIVEFKAGRTDLFYFPHASANAGANANADNNANNANNVDTSNSTVSADIRKGDLVIVEADRGKDVGRVVDDSVTLGEVEAFQRAQAERWGVGGMGGSGGGGGEGEGPVSPGGQGGVGGGGKKEISPKMIYGKASQRDLQLLATKTEDEAKALQLCQSKVRAKKLPMEVIDAEYQWDRRKLTFYFVAEKRIDFRELVRELFRLYKTRIWMASLQGGGKTRQDQDKTRRLTGRTEREYTSIIHPTTYIDSSCELDAARTKHNILMGTKSSGRC